MYIDGRYVPRSGGVGVGKIAPVLPQKSQALPSAEAHRPALSLTDQG